MYVIFSIYIFFFSKTFTNNIFKNILYTRWVAFMESTPKLNKNLV